MTRPTLVVVTADHGEALGDHGEATHSIFAYESTLRVPLIVGELGPRDGSGDRACGSVDTPARHVDLLPTMLDAARRPPSPRPASSLLGAVRDASGMRC